MKIEFKLFVPDGDLCDRCIFLVYDVLPNDIGYTPEFRCVNADRKKAWEKNSSYWDENNCCIYFSPVGGCKKL